MNEDRPVQLPVRIELQHSRLWLHSWLDADRQFVAYVNRFEEEPSYASERISVAPRTLPALFAVSINVHMIESWESPAWCDPDAPVGRDGGGLEADSQARRYGDEELRPDGGEEESGRGDPDDPEAEWRAEQRRKNRVDRMNRRLLKGEKW